MACHDDWGPRLRRFDDYVAGHFPADPGLFLLLAELLVRFWTLPVAAVLIFCDVAEENPRDA
jgi:hypothetical protein